MAARALLLVCILISIAGIRGEAAIAGPETSSITNLKTISFAADGAPQNGTNNGVGNGKLFVKIGGAESLQSTTTDGTGNGGGSGNNNGNRATGNGNGNGNGNNNAQITIVNDPAFLTCPPCQYYDPSTQLCTTVQSCVASKPATTAATPSPAGTINVGGTASAAATASTSPIAAAGRKLML